MSTEEIERVGTRTEQPFDDSSSPPSTSSSEKPGGGNTSQRIEEADHQPFLARGSVLLQIIACGSAAMKGSKTGGGGASKTASAAGSGGELNRPVQGAVSRTTVMEEEEKERLSRSVVEASKCHVHPPLKKSSSCNEERLLYELTTINFQHLLLNSTAQTVAPTAQCTYSFFGEQELKGWD